MIEYIIYNAEVVTPERVSRGFVTVDDRGVIAAVGNGMPDRAGLAAARRAIDAHGALLMPGAIDVHVHFREPGLTHKATIASESRAAVAGGVTSFFDMPNTVPQTVTVQSVADKAAVAARDSVANYAFYIGATNDNIDQLLAADYTRVPGIKLFMGSSTGNMLVDSGDALCRLFEAAPALIAVHAEDEATILDAKKRIMAEYGDNPPVALHTRLRPAAACLKATSRAVELARRYGSRLHVSHLTTAAELQLLDGGNSLRDKRITSEVSPHHLLWTDADYASKGARIKMNPSVKGVSDRDALREALANGLIDVVATDHAPHLLSEKEGGLFKAVSGAPMVQYSLAAMLQLFDAQTVARSMAAAPAELFGIEGRGRIAVGMYADLALVEKPDGGITVEDSGVLSLCGWTPLDGMTLGHKVAMTWVNGKLVYERGIIYDSHKGRQLTFKPRK